MSTEPAAPEPRSNTVSITFTIKLGTPTATAQLELLNRFVADFLAAERPDEHRGEPV